MAEESDIRIVAWPGDDLAMKHRFELEEPCPVKVSFEDTPVNVRVDNGEQPLAVDMNMRVSAREPVPLCISICEPICARSDYQITFDIFDQPVGRILVRGITRLFNCGDEPQPQPEPEQRCVDFGRRRPDEVFAQELTLGGVVFEPLAGGELKIIQWGEPANSNKLLFPASGVRITLPQPSDKMLVAVNNHFGQSLEFAVFEGANQVDDFVETVGSVPKQVAVEQHGATGLAIQGGGNEASIIELCWIPAAASIE